MLFQKIFPFVAIAYFLFFIYISITIIKMKRNGWSGSPGCVVFIFFVPLIVMSLIYFVIQAELDNISTADNKSLAIMAVEKDKEFSDIAFERISDTIIIKEILLTREVLSEENYSESNLSKIDRITNQDMLAIIAIKSNVARYSLYAAEKLIDQEALAKFAINANSFQGEEIGAWYRVIGGKKYYQKSEFSKDWKPMISAVNKITNRNLLTEIANKALGTEVRGAARRRLDELK